MIFLLFLYSFKTHIMPFLAKNIILSKTMEAFSVILRPLQRDDLDLQVDFDNREIYVSTTRPTTRSDGSFGLLSGSVASLTSAVGGGVTFHDLKFKETRGNELIPRSVIPRNQLLLLGAISSLFLFVGMSECSVEERGHC